MWPFFTYIYLIRISASVLMSRSTPLFLNVILICFPCLPFPSSAIYNLLCFHRKIRQWVNKHHISFNCLEHRCVAPPGSHSSTETGDTWTVSNLSASDPNCFQQNEGSKRHLSLRDFWGHSVNCWDRSKDTLVRSWHLEDTSLLTGMYRCKGLAHCCCHTAAP